MSAETAATPRERPILFSRPFVRAIMDGRKTVTRRPVTRLAGFGQVTEFQASTTPGYDYCFRDSRTLWNDLRKDRVIAACPYGQPGDVLWVRERWRPAEWDGQVVIEYWAGGDILPIVNASAAADKWLRGWWDCRDIPRWRPSIHMPRWACRLLLRVTEVSLERLASITDAEIQAEGFGDSDPSPGSVIARRQGFAEGWDGMYDSRPGLMWSSNPWVWVVRVAREAETPDGVTHGQV